MKTIMIAAAIAGAAAAAPAHAETYGKLFGGVVLSNDHDFAADFPGIGAGTGELETDTGYIVGGAYGVNLNEYFAVEGEVAYRSTGVDGGVVDGEDFEGAGDLNALSFMANGIVKAPQISGFRPYAGAGAGAARLGGEGAHDIVFAYQVFGGVSRDFGDKYTAGVEYRYLDASDATLADSLGEFRTEYDSHSVNFVLTRRF